MSADRRIDKFLDLIAGDDQTNREPLSLVNAAKRCGFTLSELRERAKDGSPSGSYFAKQVNNCIEIAADYYDSRMIRHAFAGSYEWITNKDGIVSYFDPKTGERKLARNHKLDFKAMLAIMATKRPDVYGKVAASSLNNK
jgi:hypothetical protein